MVDCDQKFVPHLGANRKATLCRKITQKGMNLFFSNNPIQTYVCLLDLYFHNNNPFIRVDHSQCDVMKILPDLIPLWIDVVDCPTLTIS